MKKNNNQTPDRQIDKQDESEASKSLKRRLERKGYRYQYQLEGRRVQKERSQDQKRLDQSKQSGVKEQQHVKEKQLEQEKAVVAKLEQQQQRNRFINQFQETLNPNIYAIQNFYQLYDGIKPKIRSLEHNLHVGNEVVFRKKANVKNGTYELVFDIASKTSSFIVKYVTLNNEPVADLVFNGKDYFVKSYKNTIHLSCFTQLHANALYFDNENHNLTVSGSVKLNNLLFVNANQFKLATKSSMHASRSVVNSKLIELQAVSSLSGTENLFVANKFVNQGNIDCQKQLEIQTSDFINYGDINAHSVSYIECDHYQNKNTGKMNVAKITTIKCHQSFNEEGECNSAGVINIMADDICLNGKAHLDQANLKANKNAIINHAAIVCADYR